MTWTATTAAVDPHRRLAYWTDMVCDAYVQLDCDAPSGCPFVEGTIRSDTLATLELSRVAASAQTVRRTPARIVQATEDYFLVSIQTRGKGVISQDGRDALLSPGDFALYDSTRPYTLTFDAEFEQLVVMVPGPTLRSALRCTEDLTARRVRGEQGAGHLTIAMIGTLAQDITTLAPASAAAVADGVTQILVAGLSSLLETPATALSSLTTYHRERIKALIRARHRDPGFGVADIAASLRVSASTLHRAWSGEPASITDCIWGLRLDSARCALRDPACAARGISQIAYACGFNDAAHFSRAFRARFGCSPSDYRAESGRR